MEGLTQAQFDALIAKVGTEATGAIQKELANYGEKVKAMATEIVDKKGEMISMETFNAYKNSADEAIEKITKIAKDNATSLSDISRILNTESVEATKSISQVLQEDTEELRKVYNAGQGTKTYMVTMDKNGKYVMAPFDPSQAQKATGPNATVAGVVPAAVASITQALDAATLLRVGGGAPIQGQYRNSTWVFDLCNTINASFTGSMPFAMWYDEQAKVGASTTTAEGVAKTLVQYLYQLNSATYKKEAALVGFTQEFSMDFMQLESDIMNKARIDVINRVNSAILPNIVAAATPYNTAVQFKQGVPITNVADFDALAALAAQVDNATFGAVANTAIMSTFKKYRMGVTKEVTTASYINRPDVINNLSFVGNPDMAADDVIVGDLKQYNIILRGGLIVRVGYNGTDFAQNMYSVVLEQFYFDYISTVRKPAIVKGSTFAAVKLLIST
jgi:hypothetical protein